MFYIKPLQSNRHFIKHDQLLSKKNRKQEHKSMRGQRNAKQESGKPCTPSGLLQKTQPAEPNSMSQAHRKTSPYSASDLLQER